MTRECHVRFCERLGVKLPGATLPTGTKTQTPTTLNERIGLYATVESRSPVNRRTLAFFTTFRDSVRALSPPYSEPLCCDAPPTL